MAKWVSHAFLGRSQDGSTFTLYGPAYRGLALVRIKTGAWALNHMRTGAKVTTIEGEYADVRKLSEAIAELTDWEKFETPEAAIAEPGLAKRIAALAAFHSYDSEDDVGHA